MMSLNNNRVVYPFDLALKNKGPGWSGAGAGDLDLDLILINRWSFIFQLILSDGSAFFSSGK